MSIEPTQRRSIEETPNPPSQVWIHPPSPLRWPTNLELDSQSLEFGFDRW
jgi:hypothetical protein